MVKFMHTKIVYLDEAGKFAIVSSAIQGNVALTIENLKKRLPWI
jgi:hypothetical protein